MAKQTSFVWRSNKILTRIDSLAKLLGKEFIGHAVAGAVTGLSFLWLGIKENYHLN